MKKMKLAIVGNGMIVQEALKALCYVPNVEVVGICCRKQSEEKATILANKFQIPQVFTDYDKMLLNDNIEFVYIGISNQVHYIYSLKALEADKHVIIEKPSCITGCEILNLQKIALDKQLYIFEAVTFLHAPFFEKIKQTIPHLGPIKFIQCNYSKYSSRYDRYLKHDIAPVFNPKNAGGALYDLNIYNLNFVIALFGLPNTVNYIANKGYNGVDTSGVSILQYPGFVAQCVAAKDSYSPCFDMIQGEKGWLRVTGSPDDLKELEINYQDNHIVLNIASIPHRMMDEFCEFERIYREQDYSKMETFLHLSVKVAQTAEQASHCMNRIIN